jgi:hypothetical protein
MCPRVFAFDRGFVFVKQRKNSKKEKAVDTAWGRKREAS